VRLGVGIVPQGHSPTLWFGKICSPCERARIGAGVLSGGEQPMLAIGRALMGNRRLILMDEPSEGLSPAILTEVRDIILKLKKTGLSILLAEQNFALASSVADRVYVLNKGQVAFEGTPTDLAMSELVKTRYLGV
jgi:branched-chain amino acid transport system ATP-binding protein